MTNDKLVDSYFRNLGGGKFEEVAFDVNVALREDGIFVSGMLRNVAADRIFYVKEPAR